MEQDAGSGSTPGAISLTGPGGLDIAPMSGDFTWLILIVAMITGAVVLVALIRKSPELISAFHAPYVSRASHGNGSFRDVLGTRVVGWSLLGLFVIAVFVLIAGFRTQDPLEANKWVMASVLPLIGTWVGTVLAYYFSKENFRAANEASKDLLRLTTERLAQTPARDKMIPFADIVGAIPAPGDDLKTVDLAVLETQFETETLSDGRRISRLFILRKDKSCLAILHRSTWYEMKNVAFKKVDAQGKRPLGDLTKGTFADILAEKTEGRPTMDFGTFIVEMTAYVAENASLRDVKLKMEKIQGCQDVIVTRTGAPAEPILGWITATEIAKALES